MAEPEKDLGRLVAVHGIAPAFLQRAVFIVILSFLFFLTMMFAYYIRQSLVYFLLASAFLVLYLITMFSWVMQRRNVVEIHELGLKFKQRSVYWNEIGEVKNDGSITLTDAKPFALPATLYNLDGLLGHIRRKAGVK